jgi:hypothetical protein
MIPMLTTTSTVICPHFGMATLVTSNTQLIAEGGLVLLITDIHPIVGCVFAPGGVLSPCLMIQWVTGATQTNVNGIPVLLQNSVGMCVNSFQAPQGIAIVVQTQTQAKGI